MTPVSWFVLLFMAQPVASSGYVHPASHVPLLEARETTARQRLESAQAYFAGELELRAAFPQYADVPLGSAPYLSGRLADLDHHGRDRASERRAPPPLLPANFENRWRQARRRALDSEDGADSLERRLLLGLSALLEAQPSLSQEGLATWFAPIDARIRMATERWRLASGTTREAAARDVSAATAQRANLEALVRQLRRQATAPASGAVNPAPFLKQMGVSDSGALEALLLMRPFLATTQLAETDRALIDYLTGPKLTSARDALAGAAQPVTGEPAVLEIRVQAATRRQAAIDSDLAQLVGTAPGTVDHARRSVLLVQRDTVGKQLQSLSNALGNADTVDVASQASEARQRAEQARIEAIQARALATDDSSRETAELLMSAANAQVAAARRWDRAEVLKGQLEEIQTDLQRRVALISKLPPIELFKSSRGLLTKLQESAVAAEARRREARADVRTLKIKIDPQRAQIGTKQARETTTTVPAAYAQALNEWSAALDDETEAAGQTVALHVAHRTAVLNAQTRLRTMRRGLLVPTDVRIEDQALLAQDVYAELRFALPNFWAEELGRIQEMRQLPRRFMDPTRVYDFVRQLAVFIGGLLFWWWIRSRMPSFVKLAVERWISKRDRLFAQEIRRLEAPALPFAKSLVDLVAVLVLMQILRSVVPEISLILLVYAQFLGYRVFIGLFGLLIISRERPRPALVALPPAAHAVAMRTVKLVALWLILRRFLAYVLDDLLHTVVLLGLVRALFWLFLVLVTLACLHMWEPHLQEGIRRGGGESRLIAFLAKSPHRSIFLRWLYASTDLVVLSWRGIAGVIQGRIDEDSFLGRIVTMIDRYRMAESEEDERTMPSIPEELRQLITEPNCPPDCYVERPAEDEQFFAAHKEYVRDKLRGVFALVGDRGDGKRTWLNHVQKKLEDDGRRVVRAALTERMATARDLAEWLGPALSLGELTRTQSIHTALAHAEPTTFIIEDVHLTFLRAVGGFEGLRELLKVVSLNDERHAWVLSMHRPAWWYLSRVEDAMGADIFREVIELSPLGDDALKELVLKRTSAAGYEPNFHRLVKRSPSASSQFAITLEQATHSFFRLLSDASAGNPAVALNLWSHSLSVRDHDDGQCVVHLTDAVRQASLPELEEVELFNLAALRTQDVLTAHELTRVNNMPAGQVQVSLEILFGRDLIWRDGAHIGIKLRHLPAVTRALRRRQFLHWRT